MLGAAARKTSGRPTGKKEPIVRIVVDLHLTRTINALVKHDGMLASPSVLDVELGPIVSGYLAHRLRSTHAVIARAPNQSTNGHGSAGKATDHAAHPR